MARKSISKKNIPAIKKPTSKTIDRKLDFLKKKVEYYTLENQIRHYEAPYEAGSFGKNVYKNWDPSLGSPDENLLDDRYIIAARSEDLYRNNAIARGVVATTTGAVIGRAATLKSTPNRYVLNWSDEFSEDWEQKVETDWYNFAESIECDYYRRFNLNQLCDLAYRSYLSGGDSFAVLRRMDRIGSPYKLKIQLFSHRRCINPIGVFNNNTYRDGVELNEEGAVVAYHFTKYDKYQELNYETERIEAFGEHSGRQNVLHIFRPDFINQSRGVPFYASVINEIKNTDRYTKAEMANAAVSSLFSVFIKSNRSGALNNMFWGDPQNRDAEEKDYTLEPGAVFRLDPEEEIQFADPKRPNTQFETFIMGSLRNIGIGLNIPVEMITKQFSSSFNASKAARLEAWRFFQNERYWFHQQFLSPIFREFLSDRIADGTHDAPGYFEEFYMMKAYQEHEFFGEAPGQIDPEKETRAAMLKIDAGLSTFTKESAYVGNHFETDVKVQKRERRLMVENDIQPSLFDKVQLQMETQSEQEIEETKQKTSQTAGE